MTTPRGGSWKIFDNLAFSCQHSAICGFATLCRPDSKNGKTGLKLGLIEALKTGKKGRRQPFDKPFEWHFDFCFQQNVMGVGSMAEGRRQRATKEIAKIAKIAGIGN